MKILILCHGNVNRSALCAAILRDELKDTDHEIKSAGLKPGGGGKRATAKMRDAALGFLGISLEDHRSTEVTQQMVEWADLVIDMDGGNRKRYVNMYCQPTFPKYVEGAAEKIRGLYSYVNLTRIPDPNYMRRGSKEFYDVVLMINAATKELAAAIK